MTQFGYNPEDDPLGLALKARTREDYQQQLGNVDWSDPSAYTTAGNIIQSGASQWAPWLRALQESAGGNDVRMTAGPSPKNSTQLTGYSSQPDWMFTTGKSWQGAMDPYAMGHMGMAADPSWQASDLDRFQQGASRQRRQENPSAQAAQQGLVAAGPSPEVARRRKAQMINQEQPAANWYPNAPGYKPYGI